MNLGGRALWALLWALAATACHSSSLHPSADAGDPDDAVPGDASGGDGDELPPPTCGTNSYAWQGLIPGPAEAGHDAALAHHARTLDRQAHALGGYAVGLPADVMLDLSATTARALVTTFLHDRTGWDFASETGQSPADLSGISWMMAPGAYAGPAAAADAYRYGVLRDQSAACDEVEVARQHVRVALEILHRAVAITGTPGVVARALARKDLPGIGQTPTTPLFDGGGNPLPTVKDNGTFRADVSGAYPELIWIDSCSRDQLVGWVMGMAAVWEVIRDDDTFAAPDKERLKSDAAALGWSLSVVQASGYDLEIRDADGRTTYHGYINEHAFERTYIDGLRNGFYALMALGIVGALAYVAEDPQLDAYLHDELIAHRRLHEVARDEMPGLDLGPLSDFSSYNMGFVAGWLALRYIADPAVHETVTAVIARLYEGEGRPQQPVEQQQTLYDFVYAAAAGGGSVFVPPAAPPPALALARGLASLADYPAAPAWDVERLNCNALEVAALLCQADDGTLLVLLGEINGAILSVQPVPFGVRPPSNYYWRSNPYVVNGGGAGSGLASGSDFRIAYWLARWTRR